MMIRSQSSLLELCDSAVENIAPRLGDIKLLERVVVELREIQRRTGIDRTTAIGELILNEFFAGDPALWHDRRRSKNNSIRRLAERSDCPLGKSALNDAVGVYVAVAAMPSVRTSGHITSSHVAAVLILPPAEREQVLGDADREHWSVRDIKQRIVELRRSGGERRGRPNVSKAERSIALLTGSVRGVAEAIAQVTDNLAPSEPRREAVGRIAIELRGHLESLESWLTPPVPSSRRGNLIRIDEAVPRSHETADQNGAVVSECLGTVATEGAKVGGG